MEIRAGHQSGTAGGVQNADTHPVSTEVTDMNGTGQSKIFSMKSRPISRWIIVYVIGVVTAGICFAADPDAKSAPEPSEIERIFISKTVASPVKTPFAVVRTFFGEASLIPVFKKGGPIMWPLLLASIIALGTVIERVAFLTLERSRCQRGALHDFFEAVRQSDIERALQISRESEFFVLRTLSYALIHKEQSLTNALLYAQEKEMKRFRRGIPTLDTVITLAPLLGLLGTVTGMMGSFSLIGGELSSPGAITGGIAEALIATAFGLGIAITSLIPFNLLNTKVQAAGLELESAATQLELLMHPQEEAGDEYAEF